MTGTFNQALQRALRSKLNKSVEEFVLLNRCNGVEKARRKNPNSRYNRLPDPEMKFDLRLVEMNSE
jgi:hypothetical protein